MESIVKDCMSVSEVEWVPHLMELLGTDRLPRALVLRTGFGNGVSEFGLLHVFYCNVHGSWLDCYSHNLDLTTRVRVRQRSDRYCAYASILLLCYTRAVNLRRCVIIVRMT